MANFRVETFSPWLSFEAQDHPLRFRASGASQPGGLGLAPFANGAMSGSGGETIGLANWRPPGTPSVQQSQPRPWWLFGDEPDPNTPWLNARLPDGPPGFRVAPDGAVSSSATGNPTAVNLDRKVPNFGPASPFVGGPFVQHAWPPLPQGQDEGPDSRSGLRWPWLRAEATEEPPGFDVAPDGSIAPGQTGNGGALAPNVGPTVPIAGGPAAQQTSPLTRPSLEAQPWWYRQPGQDEELEGGSDLRWPWLRAEPGEELRGSDVNADRSVNQSKPDEFSPLSFAYQPFDQMPAASIVAEGIGQPQAGEAPTPLNPTQQPSGVDGPTAASIVLPTASAVAASQGSGAVVAEVARAALGEAAALAARLAPAAARAATGPAAALSVLVTPTNSQGEIIELGDGLRSRTSTGQSSVTIERRADNGLLGTGIAARWETLPVDAELRVEKGGVTRVLIDHQQLQAAVGQEVTARALDALGNKIARPPSKGEGDSRRQANTVKQPKNAPNPENDNKPPNWPDILASTAAHAAKIWEQVNKPRSDAQDEAELAQACRSVTRARGEQTPDKQYRGKNGYETAIGVRMHPLLPDPTPGRDFSPEDPNHREGYVGEAELANLVQAQGDHFVVAFGNAPGVQGPDVLSIGRDGRFTAWDSKARSAERSVGPSMLASGSLDRQQLQAYVEREIKSGRLPPELGYHALTEFEKHGNYNVCTVGTANAHNGYIEIIRGRRSTGLRRP